MPTAKKVKTESAAPPKIPPVAWQRVADDASTWLDLSPDDSKILEAGFTAKFDSLASTEMSYSKGTTLVYDLKAWMETDPATSSKRPFRRLTPGVWEYKDDSDIFVGYYDDDCAMIEAAWRAMPAGQASSSFSTTKLSFNVGYDSKYTFTMETKDGVVTGVQHNEDSGRKRTIRRVSADVALAVWDKKDFGIAAKQAPTDATLALMPPPSADAGLQRSMSFASSIMLPPSTWQPQTSPYQLFDVAEGTAEFDNVIKPFSKKLGGVKGLKIISLRRIQNDTLWRFYALTRYRVAQRNGGDAKEKDQLYHGCRVRQNLDSIMEYGFDMRVARDGLAGLGIYFALSSSYSNCGYVLQNPDKSKEMLVCRVAVGTDAPGKHGMKRPPPKKGSTELYDSVSRLPTMYVVFDNAQAYPEYLIKYRHN